MRPVFRWLPLTVLVGLISAVVVATGAQRWPADQDARGFSLVGLPAPLVSTSPLRVHDLALSTGCIPQATGLDNPTFTCASPGGLFTPDAPLVLGGFGGSHLQLSTDGSLGVSGGNLQRGALSGAITAAAGSNTTAFGSAAAQSVLGVPGASSAVPTFFSPTLSGQSLWSTPGGTIAWQAPTAVSPLFIAGSPPQWTIQGAIVTGYTSTTPQNLGALASGVMVSTVSGGQSTLSTLAIYGTSAGLGPTALGTTGTATTLARTDQASPAYRSDLPLSTTWFVDPAGGSDAASNSCTTSATACATMHEIKRRWWGAELQANTTITILGNVPAADANVFNTTFAPGVSLTIIGSLGATTGFGGRAIDNTLYTGSVTGYVAGSATPAADDIELTDTGIPVSFTASGLLADGVIFRRTVTATRHWYAAKDLGAKTIRISAPMSLATPKSFAANPLTVGDAYSAFAMWTLPTQDFGFSTTVHVFVDTVVSIAASGSDILAGGPRGYTPLRTRVWFLNPSFGLTWGTSCTNCAISLTSSIIVSAGINTPPNWSGGMIRGTGASSLVFFGSTGIGGATIFQGASMELNDWSYFTVESAIAFFDVTSPYCILIIGSGYMSVTNPLGVGGFSGKGNTGKLLNASIGGRLYYGQGIPVPIFNAASTTDPNPISIEGTSYPVSALPAVADVVLNQNTQFPSTVFETGSATRLFYGAVADGSLLGRSGTSIVGVATSGFLADPGANGIVVRTSAGTTTARTLTGTAGNITVANGTGVSGNPTFDLATTGVGSGSCTYCSLTVDTFGRLSAQSSGAAPVPATRTVTGTAPIAIAGDHAAHDLSADRTWSLDANGITDALIRQGGALSLIGRSANSAGNVADISATAASGAVMRESGSTIGWGTIATAGIANSAVTYAKLQNETAQTILGNSNASTAAAPAEITIGTGLSLASGVLSATGGAGTVTSVTATAPLFSSAGATPNLTIQGSITSGSTSTSAQSLGALTNGTLQQTVSASVATVSAFNGTAASVPFYTTSGQLAQDNARFNYDSTNHTLLLGSTNSTFDLSTGLAALNINNTGSQSLLTFRFSGAIAGGVRVDSSGNFNWHSTGGQGHQFYKDAGISAHVASIGGTGVIVSNGAGDVAASGEFQASGTMSLTALSMTKSGSTQTINKTGGQLTVQTGDANALVLGTNGSARVNLDSAGNTQWFNDVTETHTSSSTALAATKPTVAEYAITPASTASAASLGALHQWDAVTVTLTGSTHHTGTGLALAKFVAPTITDASAVTVDTAATVTITGAPAAAGSVTLTNAYALWVQGGIAHFDTSLFAVNGTSISGAGALTVNGLGSGYVKATTGLLSTVTGPPSASYKWSKNFEISPGVEGMIASNLQTVVVLGDTGDIQTGGNMSAVAGTSPDVTMVANVASAVAATAYKTTTAISGGTFSAALPWASLTGSGSCTLRVALWGAAGQTFGYSLIANVDFTLSGTSNTLRDGVSTTFGSVAAGTHLIVAMYRTDTNPSCALNNTFATATMEAYQ